MIGKLLMSVLIGGTLVNTVEHKDGQHGRESKQLVPGLFSIVRFPNDQCDGETTG